MSAAYSLGRAVRAVWNGPFHVGKISRPVSVGDALLKLLETLWRAAVAAVAIILTIIATIWAWVEHLSPTLFPPLANSIMAEATYDDGQEPRPPAIVQIVVPAPPMAKETAARVAANEEARKRFLNMRCSPEYPIMIEFHNRSKKTVRRVSFAIKAFKPNHSTNLSHAHYLESDAIIEPGYRVKSCWNAGIYPTDQPAGLSYSVEVIAAERARS